MPSWECLAWLMLCWLIFISSLTIVPIRFDILAARAHLLHRAENHTNNDDSWWKLCNVGWIHGDPNNFWKMFSWPALLCGNDGTSLKNMFGNKLGGPSSEKIRALEPYVATWSRMVRSCRKVFLTSLHVRERGEKSKTLDRDEKKTNDFYCRSSIDLSLLSSGHHLWLSEGYEPERRTDTSDVWGWEITEMTMSTPWHCTRMKEVFV
jgi:hypothetical protein